ncbi:MAG: SPOR domain-containing protein [Chitinispirillales bacterium]|jgi:cell division septation protein DedD|nr:SPOR domain-containing protein [Chitinispirillales bacterium]
MLRKYLIPAVAVTAVALLFPGCPGKDIDDMDFSSPKPAQPVKKSDDIFDEFYIADETKTAPAPAPVTPEPTPAPAPQTPAPARPQPAARGSGGPHSFAPNGNYVVQVNSTASRSGADRMAATLKGKGHPAYVAEVQNPTPELTGTYFRVRIGAFNSIADARNFAQSQLVPAGYDFWVDRRANDNVGIRGGGFGAGGHQQFRPAPAPQPAPAAQPAPAPAPAPQAAPVAQPAPAPAPAPQPAAQPQAETFDSNWGDDWGTDEW